MQSFCSAFFLRGSIKLPIINRPTVNLRAVCERVDAGHLVDDRPVGEVHDSGLVYHLEGEEGHDSDHDFDTAVARLADAGRGFGMADDHPAGDHPVDAGHGFDTADGHLAGGRPVAVVRGFDTADDHLVDDRLAGADRDFGTDAHPAGLDRVAVLHVSLYRHHRAHTSYGIPPGYRLVNVADVARSSFCLA